MKAVQREVLQRRNAIRLAVEDRRGNSKGGAEYKNTGFLEAAVTRTVAVHRT